MKKLILIPLLVVFLEANSWAEVYNINHAVIYTEDQSIKPKWSLDQSKQALKMPSMQHVTNSNSNELRVRDINGEGFNLYGQPSHVSLWWMLALCIAGYRYEITN